MNTILRIYDITIRELSLIFALLFVYFYRKVDWKATPYGRHLMQFTRMLIVFLLLITLVIIFGRQDWYEWVARGAFTWMAYLLYRRVALQRQAQRKNSVSDTPELNTNVTSE